MIEYDNLQRSLRSLDAQFNNYKSLDPKEEDLILEAIKESVIQRFEICYDCVWKVLKLYMQEELGLPDIPSSPKPLIRMAGEQNLLDSAVEQWFEYADARVETTHDDSAKTAEAALVIMGDFIEDAIALYETMSKERWE